MRGLAVHGIGAAARVYFSKPAGSLTLEEAAALAAMIQAPNRLSPIEHAAALRERRDWVLSRLADLEWATKPEVERAKAQPVRGKLSPPASSAPRQFVSWIAELVEDEKPSRVEDGRGFLVETTLDPWLQDLAEHAVADQLDALRGQYPKLRQAGLAAALVALDARTGAVIAYVGGDPEERAAEYDHARSARRQPGSIVKPFVVLQALDECGRREPLTASSRIADQPLTIDLPSGDWSPQNFDGRFLGPILLREALAESRNVPAVRIARWCGFDATAETFERAGFDLPKNPPPSFVLGAIESTPLAVARAYTAFATPGRVLDTYAMARLETPGGRGLARSSRDAHRVAGEEAAYLVRDLMRTAVERGTAAPGDIRGLDVAGQDRIELRPARRLVRRSGRLGGRGGVGRPHRRRPTRPHRRTGRRPDVAQLHGEGGAGAPAARNRAARGDPRALGRDRHRSHGARGTRRVAPRALPREHAAGAPAVVAVRRADAADRVARRAVGVEAPTR